MALAWLYNELRYEIRLQNQVELKYILLGAQKIRTGVDIEWGPHLLQDQKKMYLDFDQLVVL